MTTRPDTLARALLRQRALAEGRGEPTEAEVEAELAACRPERPAYMEETFRALDGIAAADRLQQAAQHAMEARIVAAVVEGLRQPQERAPRRRKRQQKAGRFAEFGAEGGAASALARATAADLNVRTAAELAKQLQAKGPPPGGGRWSLEKLGWHMGDWWPEQPPPAVRTLQGYVRKARKAGL